MPTLTTDISNTLRDWRCRGCHKLLGKHDGQFLHVRQSRGANFVARLPATADCRCCGRLNELFGRAA